MHNFNSISELYVRDIFVADLVRNNENPFTDLSDKSFTNLLNSIRRVGILEPIAVRKIGGSYEIISGNRRVLIAEMLNFKTVPAIVYEVDDDEAVVLNVDSNVTFKEVTDEE